MKKVLFIFLALFLSAQQVSAYSSPGAPSGFVNDFAVMLSVDQRQTLEAKLSQFEKETSNEITIVTINNLGGDTIENFATKLFEEWKIGKKNKDNGVLLLIARDDRQMRIEVGYGLEGALTDAQSFWIIQNIMLPAFRQNDFGDGITNAIDKIIAATKGEYVPAETPSPNSGVKINFRLFEALIFFALIAFAWLAAILARSKSWWAGGVVGAAIGIILLFIFGLLIGVITILLLSPLGLLFDYAVSKNYQQRKSGGQKPSWWAGGGLGGHGGFGGRGGFGGFGGGSSGGGGASGRW